MSSVKTSMFGILRKPRITEKGAISGAESNSVVFDVHPKANKTEIKHAVEKIFDVKVKAVRVMNYRGKLRKKAKSTGFQAKRKTAYVSLKEGSTIDLIEGL